MALISDSGPDHVSRVVVIEDDEVRISWAADGEVIPVGRGRVQAIERYTKDRADRASGPTQPHLSSLVDDVGLVGEARTTGEAIVALAQRYVDFIDRGLMDHPTDETSHRIRAEAMTWARETLMLMSEEDGDGR